MPDCDKQLKCCEITPVEGTDCCQPQPYDDYRSDVFLNTEQCYTAECPTGTVGSPVTVCSSAGSFQSTISQEDADSQALAAATAEATSRLSCSSVGGCTSYSVNQTVNIDDPCITPYSVIITSGPCGQQNHLVAYDLYTLFPYVKMWDGVCPLVCRDAPRAHTNPVLTIGPYAFNVEIYAITGCAFDDDYGFDGIPSNGNCCQNNVAGGTVLKTLTAGNTTTFTIYEKYGAHCWAAGWIGVRQVGVTTSCGTCSNVTAPPESIDVCGCSGTLTIERIMRAFQERRNVITGTFINWPDRVLPVPGDPGNYPADGFYDADIAAAADPDAHRATLIQFISDQLSDTWLNGASWGYSSVSSWDGLTSIPMHSVTSTMPPLTVTSANWLISLRTIQSYCCQMQYLRGVSFQADVELRDGQGIDTSCASAKTGAATAFAADPWTSDASGPRGIDETSNTTLPDFAFTIRASRMKYHYNTANIPAGQGTTSLWCKLIPLGSGVTHSADAPNAVDSKYHTLSAGTPALATADWLTDYINNVGNLSGEMDCAPDGSSIYKGWSISGDSEIYVQVFKSNRVVDADWTYFP